MIHFEIKNKIKKGDIIEVFQPGIFESKKWTVTTLVHKNKEKDVLSGGLGMVSVDVPFPVAVGSFLSVISLEEVHSEEYSTV